MTTTGFRKLALSFQGTTEAPHFERTSFRVGTKIFATLMEKTGVATLRLTPEQQTVFIEMERKAFAAVTGKWGKQGWTYLNITMAAESTIKDALESAYGEVQTSRRSRRRGE
jgi:hypothetical protein